MSLSRERALRHRRLRLRAVSPAGVKKPSEPSTAPDDHFTAGPHCGVSTRRGRVGGAGGCPTVCAGIVSPASVQNDRPVPVRPRRSFHCRSTLRCENRAVGAFVVLVAVQLSVPGLYLPPVFQKLPSIPPQTIISLPVQTAVCKFGLSGRVGGAGGCPTIRAGIVSPAGVQIAWCHRQFRPRRSFHCRSRLPCGLAVGALVVLVAVQLSVLGLYLPPVFSQAVPCPPQTIISLPVQTAV